MSKMDQCYVMSSEENHHYIGLIQRNLYCFLLLNVPLGIAFKQIEATDY